MVILKNSLAIPKLLYLLRTSQCSNNPLLRQFNDTLWAGLITILTVDINNDQWLQASLPVGDDGLGIWSAEMLAPSAYFGFSCSHTPAPAIHTPRQHLDARRSVGGVYCYKMDVPANSSKPSQQTQHIQKNLGWTSCSKSKEANPSSSSISRK